MCGIFGYIGKERDDLSSFLLQGLSKLDYRGYDSSGIAILNNNCFKIKKSVGEVSKLQEKLKGKKISGDVGIGHTRWATHGGVNIKNAHPHKDCTGKIVVVHNGIIENFEELKIALKKKGHKFLSDTDTEVVAHLIENEIKKKTFWKAVRDSFKVLKGLNAIVVANSKGELVAFRKGSPLVAGVKGEEKYISSDIPALSEFTSKMLIIDESEGVYMKNDEMERITLDSDKKYKPVFTTIKMKQDTVRKKGFRYYLLKEIFEQSEVVERVAENNKRDILEAARMVKDAWGTYFTACGTAAHAGLAATYMFSEIAKRHVNFSVGSEFPYFQDFLVRRSLLIAASQSGETMDTLEAVRAAKKYKSKVLALVNVPSSTLSRISDKTIYLNAGPERSVLSTKTYVAKLATFLLFAYTIAGKYKKGVNLLKTASGEISKMIGSESYDMVKKISTKLAKKEHIYIIGRGLNYATAKEGAHKIKEASYIHAEGFAGGELKHCEIALIEKGTPCIVVVANDRAKSSIMSNAIEVKSRGGMIIGISPDSSDVFDYHIKVPDVGDASPIISVIPMQLMAYFLAVKRGFNPDRPRNLAKSVTVK